MAEQQQQEDLTTVIEELEAKCRELPDNVMAHHHLALVYRKAGRIDDAINTIKKCIELDPHSAESHVNLGALYFEAGELDKAPGRKRSGFTNPARTGPVTCKHWHDLATEGGCPQSCKSLVRCRPLRPQTYHCMD